MPRYPRPGDIIAAALLWAAALIIFVFAIISAGSHPDVPEQIGNGILFVFACFLAVLGRSALK